MDLNIFGDEITRPSINRNDISESLYVIMSELSIDEFTSMITNKFIETIEYAKLLQGFNTCQKTSLLFNPHRLDTKTSNSKLSIFSALKTRNFCDGLARATIFKDTKVKELLYQVLQLGVNGVQYVNEFPPHIARDLAISLQIGLNSKVLDPCGGWGGRQIGISAVCNNYTSYEPSTKTFNGLIKLSEFIRVFRNDFKPIIHKLQYELSDIKENYYDMALTSPPYYDTEHYSDEPTNSFNAYNTFEKWTDIFYLPLIYKTMRQLKSGASFILNIGSRKYPLNQILLSEFGTKYHISKIKSNMGGESGGLKNTKKEGETFYRIIK